MPVLLPFRGLPQRDRGVEERDEPCRAGPEHLHSRRLQCPQTSLAGDPPGGLWLSPGHQGCFEMWTAMAASEQGPIVSEDGRRGLRHAVEVRLEGGVWMAT